MPNSEMMKSKLQKTIIEKKHFVTIYLFSDKLKENCKKYKPELKIK